MRFFSRSRIQLLFLEVLDSYKRVSIGLPNHLFPIQIKIIQKFLINAGNRSVLVCDHDGKWQALNQDVQFDKQVLQVGHIMGKSDSSNNAAIGVENG